MMLRLEWGRTIQLSDASEQNLIYSFDHTKLPKTAGIYIFGRKFGRNFSPCRALNDECNNFEGCRSLRWSWWEGSSVVEKLEKKFALSQRALRNGLEVPSYFFAQLYCSSFGRC